MSRRRFPNLPTRLWRGTVERLWSAGTEGASRSKRLALSVARVAYIAAEGFVNDLCLLRAGGLAFASLLALVPTFALAFTVLRALGWRGSRLEELILSRATVLSPDAIQTVVQYIDNTSFAGLGAAGAAILLFTFVSVMANIEEAFNAIWGNVAPRTVFRRVTDYFGVMLVAPLFLAVAASATAVMADAPVAIGLQARWDVLATADQLLEYGVYVLVWLLFAFLYAFMPNTRVNIFAALVGGVVAGSVWQFTQWAYLQFQANVGEYNAIYGALAQLPVLMAWFYLSWVIVLIGAEITYGVQNLGVYAIDRLARHAEGRRIDDYVAIALCAELAREGAGNGPSAHPDLVAGRIGVPPRLLGGVSERLRRRGVLEPGDHPGHWALATPANELRLAALVAIMEGSLPPGIRNADAALGARIHDVLARAALARDGVLAEITVEDLHRCAAKIESVSQES
jgi:membrane protein